MPRRNEIKTNALLRLECRRSTHLNRPPLSLSRCECVASLFYFPGTSAATHCAKYYWLFCGVWYTPRLCCGRKCFHIQQQQAQFVLDECSFRFLLQVKCRIKCKSVFQTSIRMIGMHCTSAIMARTNRDPPVIWCSVTTVYHICSQMKGAESDTLKNNMCVIHKARAGWFWLADWLAHAVRACRIKICAPTATHCRTTHTGAGDKAKQQNNNNNIHPQLK